VISTVMPISASWACMISARRTKSCWAPDVIVTVNPSP
jgi:hypothetical protein